MRSSTGGVGLDPRHIRDLLAEALPGARWDPPADAFDDALVGRIDGRVLRGEIRTHAATRLPELLGDLSRMVLTMRAAVRVEAVLLAVAVVPTLSDATVARVRAFMESVAGEVGWALIARDGKAVVVVPPLDLEWAREGALPRKVGPPARTHRPFTDMNRCLLKAMLLAGADPGFWGGPRCGSPSSIRELQEATGVAYETARRFVNTFDALGFIGMPSGGPVLIRIDQLVDALLQDERQTRRSVHPMRWLPGRPGNLLDEIRRLGSGVQLAVAGWEACRLHRVLVRGSPHVPELHVENGPHRLAEAWELGPCEPRDAHLLLVASPYPRSVFGGVVPIDGVPVVDVLQAALDVFPDPKRGVEQADHILGEVLGLPRRT